MGRARIGYNFVYKVILFNSDWIKLVKGEDVIIPPGSSVFDRIECIEDFFEEDEQLVLQEDNYGI